tara:strand:+ start:275 stop:550 length:276 start_codon:yes stop_codon:yes gene_type:complete
MVVVLDILASLLMLGAAVTIVTEMLQSVWQVQAVVDQTLMVVLVLVVVTLDKVVPLAADRVAVVVKPKRTIMVDRQVVTAQHLRVIAMADR